MNYDRQPALADGGYVEDIVPDAVNRKGRAVTVRVVCGALRNQREESTGAILVMEVLESPEGARPGTAGTSPDQS